MVIVSAGDEVVELNGELLSGLSDEVLQQIVHSAERSAGEVELVIRLQSVLSFVNDNCNDNYIDLSDIAYFNHLTPTVAIWVQL